MDIKGKLKIYLAVIAMALCCPGVLACTIGVASGKATSDGRPILWKTRDYEVKPNVIHYTETEIFNFVSNITPEYGYDKSWFGLNDAGFAIVNAFIRDFPEGETGLGNGLFMHYVLGNCSSVDDFIAVLDSTNISGRMTRAIFGVIDSAGSAAIFEVGSRDYRMYDARDKKTAPDGYIIRSNYAFSIGGDRGIERYKRSGEIIRGLHGKNNLNVKTVMQKQMRDMADPTGKPVSPGQTGIFDCSKNICKHYSISATVIQGVKIGEPALLSTMWAMIGNPFGSVATPYWPAGDTPTVASSDSHSMIYEVSEKLKKHVFDTPGRHQMVNVPKVRELNERVFKVENSIYRSANKLLEKWRKRMPSSSVMLKAEREFAEYAYSGLVEISKSME